MAQHGAHINSSQPLDDRPTVFEVLAQESLSTTIRPAARHAVKVLAESKPEKFGWMLRFFDEIYTVLELVLQNHYFKKHAGSFSEKFYDLQRVVSKTNSPVLTKAVRWKSLICLVVLPYLKQKLDILYEDLKHKSHSTGTSQNLKSRVIKAFLAIYPYLHMVWEGSNMWFQLAYMFGKANCHSWLLWLSGTELRRRSPDKDAINPLNDINWQDSSVKQRLYYLLRKLMDMLSGSMSTGLSVGVFFLQFLQWWYQSEERTSTLSALPIPRPPKENVKTKNKDAKFFKSCPICKQERSNETALSVSGYVFCFRCIYNYIKKHGCCPVTQFPARIEHLIKIFPPND